MTTKTMLIPLAMLLSACQSTSVLQPEPTATIKPSQEIVEPLQKTSIFYYYLDPVNPTQAVSIVRGSFVWRDHCLYLIGNDRELYTAAFPQFPKGIVNWNEATKTLNLNGRVFKMGDYISTNGSYQRYATNTAGSAEYEKQGDKKCLTPSIVKIGTFFD